MIAVTIQCGCGQRYEFEIEPVEGRMPSAVACPVCGADGTDAANAAIAESLRAPPAGVAAVPAFASPPDPAATSTRLAARRAAAMRPRPIDRTQAQHEARARISWGDPPEEVTRYLMVQGFNREEAADLVEELSREKAATIRGTGVMKIALGVVLMSVPVIAYLIFLSIKVIYVRAFVITIAVGLWGTWIFAKGLFMVVSPKSELDDVTED